LYTGVTNDIERRAFEHKTYRVPGFATRYRISRLVYFERHRYIGDAIRREKEIKSWRRSKKVALIEASNPTWDDLAADWFGPPARRKADSFPALPAERAGSE
jgi:putative endonuclease